MKLTERLLRRLKRVKKQVRHVSLEEVADRAVKKRAEVLKRLAEYDRTHGLE